MLNLVKTIFRCCRRELKDRPEEFVTVVVSDPHKVGEGISSYMVYRVSTRLDAQVWSQVCTM